MTTRQKLKRQRPKPSERAIAYQPLIDSVQDSLDRFQVLLEEGGDLDAAIGDLLAVVSDLEDAVEKNWQAEADEATERTLRARKP